MSGSQQATDSNLEAEVCILFADLVGSVQVSNEHSIEGYYIDYIRQYYDCVEAAIAYTEEHRPTFIHLKRRYVSYRGDEAIAFVPLGDHSRERARAVGEVCLFALALRLFWLCTPYNVRRLLSGQLPRSVAIGIHAGRVLRPRFKGSEFHVGYAVNVSKRIESCSRRGTASRIMVSGEVREIVDSAFARRPRKSAALSLVTTVQVSGDVVAEYLKGVDPQPDVFELDFGERYEWIKALATARTNPNGTIAERFGALGRNLRRVTKTTRERLTADSGVEVKDGAARIEDLLVRLRRPWEKLELLLALFVLAEKEWDHASWSRRVSKCMPL